MKPERVITDHRVPVWHVNPLTEDDGRPSPAYYIERNSTVVVLARDYSKSTTIMLRTTDGGWTWQCMLAHEIVSTVALQT